MIAINEWLPDPVGPDVNEWIELFNSGSSGISLSGWKIQASSGKSAKLFGEIASGEYRVFPKSETKLLLKNRAEKITLFDRAGNMADEAYFPGSAIEGQSLNRGEFFIYPAAPTPGAPNVQTPGVTLLSSTAQLSVPRSGAPGLGLGVVLSAAAGLLFAAGLLYVILKDNDLSNFFFGRN